MLLIEHLKRRLGSPVIACTLLCLSLAVFHWGLQYKMSLYQNPDGLSKGAPAKLWVAKEDTAVQSALPPLLIELVFIVLVAPPVPPKPFACQRLRCATRLRFQAFLNASFLRPPPVLA